MKAIIALSLFMLLSSCTQPDGKGGAQGEVDPASDSESGANPSGGSGTPTSKPDEENYGSKKDKDVETVGSATPDAETASPADPATPSPADPATPSPADPATPSPADPATPSPADPATPSPADPESPSASALDSDIDGVTDDQDVCPGVDDALQTTRYKLTDADNDGYADGSLSALVCPSNTEYTLTLPEVIYNDCDGANGSKWQMLSYSHRDADGDGHSIVSAGSICSGNALPAGYLTSPLGTTDCSDTNDAYHTVATYYSYPADTTTDRYSRTSESACVPSNGFGLVNAYKEYRLAPEIISASGLSSINGFYEFAGKAYFLANSSSYGNELWSTDGTLAGATMIKDINPGTAHSSPSNFIKVGSTLYFTAYDGSGIHLWKTDGTEAGTIKVKAGITPSLLTDVNGTLFFVADDGSGTELWKSDGTDAGTVLIKDINAGYYNSNPTSLTNLNGTLLFAADDGTHGIELWKSDGTEAGTVLVKDIDTDADSSPSDFLVVGGTLFFSATLDSTGRELWKSDGTEAGTSMVKDINPGDSSSLGTSYFTKVNSTLFFRADNGSSGSELWKSDGTEAGTTMIKDIRSGSSGSSPSSLIAVNGTLFFSANNGTQGSELWKSDGTEAGTTLVKDVNSGSGSASMVSPIAVGSILYYRTDDGTHNSEVWKSDGTEAGTILVKDINSNGSSNPQSLSVYGDRLIFVAAPPEGARIHIGTNPL